MPPSRCLGAAPISSAHAPAQQPRHGSSSRSRRLDRGQAASRRRGCRFRPRPRTLVACLRWPDAEEAARAAACTRCWAWPATAPTPSCAVPTASSPWLVTSALTLLLLLGVSSSPVRLPCFAQRSDSAALLTGELMACVGGQKWHPDKCAGAGSSAGSADAAKARFQKIQGAYAGNQSASYDMR